MRQQGLQIGKKQPAILTEQMAFLFLLMNITEFSKTKKRLMQIPLTIVEWEVEHFGLVI